MNRRVDPTGVERRRRLPPLCKEVHEQLDWVGDVNCSIIIGVGGVEACWSSPLSEDVAQDENWVRDIDATADVRVAALKGAKALIGESVPVFVCTVPLWLFRFSL